MTLLIHDSLYDAAEQLAKRLGISRSELVRRALRTFLWDNRQEGIAEALNAFYEDKNKKLGIDPILAALQAASIAREEW